jgi:hypothetical protein
VVLIRRAFLLSSLWVLSVLPAWTWAQSVESLTLQNPSCPLRFRQATGAKGPWRPYARSIAKGTEVQGQASARDPDIVVFRVPSLPRIEFVGRRSCLFSTSVPSGQSVAIRSGRLKKDSSWILFLDATSWQEKLTIEETQTDRRAELRSTQVGFCPGLQFLSSSERWERGWGICGVYAKAQIANAKAPEVGELDYDAKNADVFGVKVYPSLYFRPRSENVAVGLLVPVLVRYAPWPIPQSASSPVTVGPKFDILAGLELEARFERGIFVFSQKVGFYNMPKSLNWSMRAGFKFE